MTLNPIASNYVAQFALKKASTDTTVNYLEGLVAKCLEKKANPTKVLETIALLELQI